VEISLRRDLFELIDQTPHLDWQLLTKRPENIRKMWPARDRHYDKHLDSLHNPHFRENVWIGTSISNQATADKAVPDLLMCNDLAPVLFLSAEPLLGPINLQRLQDDGRFATPGLDGLDWIIVGGESGSGARPCNLEWIDDIRQQCHEAGVPCFVKQFGANVVQPTLQGEIVPVRFEDRKGGDMDEWPEDLRVREFPVVTG
jgi:protein gp37